MVCKHEDMNFLIPPPLPLIIDLLSPFFSNAICCRYISDKNLFLPANATFIAVIWMIISPCKVLANTTEEISELSITRNTELTKLKQRIIKMSILFILRSCTKKPNGKIEFLI